MSFSAYLLLCGVLANEPAPATVQNRRLEKNQTMAGALHKAGLDSVTVEGLLGALSASEYELRRARAGDQLRLVIRNGQLDVMEVRRNAINEWYVRRDGDRYIGRKREVEREQKVEVIELTVKSSVWDAAKAAGEKPEVAMTLADVFAWDIDFYRDVQKGDTMRAVVEKVFAKGRLLGYGNVLAASYKGSTIGTKRIYRYTMPEGATSYFQRDGLSARKTFLKSPLKFAHVTSGFGGRLHPILNYVSAHNGIDYGTPTGTPVWAVADGVVTKAGWDRGGGNMVCLRHALSLETCYLHLSKINVKANERVFQKDVLGESGSTGLSTGPHLHFGMKRGGSWINPLNQNFPRAEPLPVALKTDFTEHVGPLDAMLEVHAVAQSAPSGTAATQ
jgi:murein DD-endopeptidase MepM/ murein hydrolase activator NlpD